MYLDVFRFYDGCRHHINTADYEHNINLPLMPGDEKYGIAIDPGTVSMGFIIGDLTTRKVFYWIEIKRNASGGKDAETQDTFVANYLTFFKNLIELYTSRKIKYLEIETPYVDPHKNKDTYVALKKVLDGTISVCRSHGILTFPTPPKTWQSWYLGPYKIEMNLNLNKSNKEAIKVIGLADIRNICDSLPDNSPEKSGFIDFLIDKSPATVKSDTFDAKGIWEHFLAVNIPKNDVIRVNPSLPRTLKEVNVSITTYRDQPTKTEAATRDFIQSVKDRLEGIYRREVPEVHFEYCYQLSAEDNIKALVQQYGEQTMFIAVANISISMLPELYRNVSFKAPTITPKTLVVIVGYRAV